MNSYKPEFGVIDTETNYIEATFTNKSDALEFAEVRYYYTGRSHAVIIFD